MTLMTSREFNQDVAAAKRAAATEPVLITDRGEPAFVLLSIDEYRRLSGGRRNIAEALATDHDFDWEPEVDRSIWPDRVVFDDEDDES